MSVPIICDSGTGYLKIGWANQNFPLYSIPAIIGRPMLRFGEKIGNIELKDVMVGDEAAPLRSFLELTYPVEEGIVNNWDDMCRLWDRGFDKMGVKPKESAIMMTEPVLNPVKNREKMTEVLFEKYGFDKMQIGIQALLSLFAEGLMTSTLVDSGDGVTHCIPVVEGYILKHQISRMNIAGRHVTNYLVKLLFLKGYAFNSSADFEIVREIKERSCFVSADIDLDRRLCKETTCLEHEYKLPDGSLIKIGRERFEAAEILFSPYMGGYEFSGVSDIVFDTINNAPMDTRKSLYESIMISGGTSMFPGFSTRLLNDVTKRYRSEILKGNKDAEIKIKIDVIDPPRRKYNVFIGGGVLATAMAGRADYWITQKDYKEYGTNVVRKIGESLAM